MISTKRMFKRRIVIIYILISVLIWQFYLANSKTIVHFNAYFANTSSSLVYHELDENYKRLINLTGFKFTTLNFVCNPSTKLLVMVNSAPTNFEGREVIRETWGRKREGMSLGFLLGDVENSMLNEHLATENEKFQDLLQGNFVDSYRNLTYKLIAGMKYAKYHCARAKYFLKIDDDMFVDMKSLLQELEHFKAEGLIFGYVCRGTHPVVRDKENKWFVDKKEYPDEFYPEYVAGYYTLFSSDVVRAIHDISHLVPFIPIEDVFGTGIIREKLGLEATSAGNKQLSSREVKNITYGEEKHVRPFLFSYHQLENWEIQKLWNMSEQ